MYIREFFLFFLFNEIMRERNVCFLFILITSTLTTEILESGGTSNQTQIQEESYGGDDYEYNDSDMTGRVIAENYRIQSKLGAGSFGQVYLCEHIHTHEQWAIKIELLNSNNHPILSSEVDKLKNISHLKLISFS